MSENVEQARSVLARHPELLSDSAFVSLSSLDETFEKQHVNLEARRLFAIYMRLLQQCRQVGVDKALAQHFAPDADEIPELFQRDVAVIRAASAGFLDNSPGAYEEAIAAAERIIHNPAFSTQPPTVRATAIGQLGEIFFTRYSVLGDSRDLDHVTELWQQA